MAENHHFDRKAPWARVAPIVVLFVLTVAFFWKLTLTDQYIWFDHPDMAYLEIPRLEFQARELHAGRFPLWDPYLWSGQPLIGQTQPGPLFPLNILFYLAPLRDGYLRFAALNWYWVIIHFLAAAMAYFLARDLGLSQAAGVLGGVAFGLGGFVGTVAWLDVVNGIIWAPAVFLFLLRAGRMERPFGNAAGAGLCLGMAWLSGHHEMPLLLSTAAAGTWCWLSWRNRRLILPGLLLFAVVVLASGVQTLPTYEFGRLSRRWVGLEQTVGWKDKIPYKVQTIYSLPPKGFLAIVLPGLGRFADSSPYFGWLVSIFAFLGVVMRWRDRVVGWALVLAAIFAVYSVGVFAPLNGVIYALVPILDKARIPSRGMAMLGFAVCVLAMHGFEAVLRDSASAWCRRAAVFLGAAGLVILLFTLGFVLAERPLDDRITLGALVCLSACGLLFAWRKEAIGRSALAWSLLVLVLVELSSGGPALYSNRFDQGSWGFARKLEAHRDIADFLRKELQGMGPFRVVVNDEEVGINFGDWYGIDTLHGYVAGASANLLRHELHTTRTQDLFGVRYWLGTKPDRPGGQEEVFTGSSGIKVFRNPTPFPRAWLVHETKEVPNDDWLRVAIQDQAIDLSRTGVFVGKAPAVERCEGENRASFVSRGSDRMTLRVETPCAAVLVVSETNFPGWTVRVDGKTSKAWEAYGALRGVVVPGGKHEVEWIFRPRSVYLGLGLTVLGLMIAGGAIISRR